MNCAAVVSFDGVRIPLCGCVCLGFDSARRACVVVCVCNFCRHGLLDRRPVRRVDEREECFS